MDSCRYPSGPEYGAQVWKRSFVAFQRAARLVHTASSGGVAASAACAALMAGHSSPGALSSAVAGATGDRRSQAGERVLLVAVGDYLERS